MAKPMNAPRAQSSQKLVPALALSVTWCVGMGWGPVTPLLAVLVAYVAIAICLQATESDGQWMLVLGIGLFACCLIVFLKETAASLALNGLFAAQILIYLAAVIGARLHAGAECSPLVVSCIVASTVNAAIGLWQWLSHLRSDLVPPAEPIFGLLYQRNQFATLMCIGLAAIVYRPDEQLVQSRAALVRISGIILLSSANALTESRTGLIGQLLVLCSLVLRRDRSGWRNWGAFWIVVSYLVATLLNCYFGIDSARAGAIGRLANESVDCHSRWVLWGNVFQLVIRSPLTGWGWGNLDMAHVLQDIDAPRFCELLDNAHNLPLHLAVELGIPLATLFGALFFFVLARGWSTTSGVRSTWLYWTILSLIGMHSLVEYPLWYAPFQVTLGLCLGGILQAGSAWSQGVGEIAAERRRWSNRCVAIMAIVATSYVGWDYWRVSQAFLRPQDRAPHFRITPLNAASDSWIFRDVVNFASLTTTPITSSNVKRMEELAKQQLHYSPEPAVLEALIEAYRLMNELEEERHYSQQYQKAFPKQFDAWTLKNKEARSSNPESTSVAPSSGQIAHQIFR
jgi:O-antigen ligase